MEMAAVYHRTVTIQNNKKIELFHEEWDKAVEHLKEHATKEFLLKTCNFKNGVSKQMVENALKAKDEWDLALSSVEDNITEFKPGK
jgi:hypothetical protein